MNKIAEELVNIAKSIEAGSIDKKVADLGEPWFAILEAIAKDAKDFSENYDGVDDNGKKHAMDISKKIASFAKVIEAIENKIVY